MTSALILALLFAQQVTPPEKCTISGTVVDSITGLPLGKADVVAEHITGQEPRASTTTDATGKFVMVDVDPGRYRLSAKRNGYPLTYLGSNRSVAEGSTITLAAGQKMEGLTIRLTPLGVIAGTVRDSDGEPLAGVPVLIFTVRHDSGRRRIQVANDTRTDDLGQYRFTSLSPGNYYVSTWPDSTSENGATVDHSVKSNERPQIPISTFYPGTSDPSVARVIAVAAGARVLGIDITPVRSPVYRVMVHIDALTGLGATASLRSGVDGLGGVGDFRRVNPTGDMEVDGVPPGSYKIVVGNFEPSKSSEGPSGRILCQMSFPLMVSKEDVAGVRLAAKGCAEVSGHITVEGEKAPKFGDAQLVFGPEEEMNSWAGIKAGGSFQTLLSPGQHTVDLSPIMGNSGLYLKSIRSGGQDILRDGFTAAGAEHIDLDIVLAQPGGRIDGSVTDRDNKPVATATVVLIPDDPALRARLDFTRTAVTDHGGHFEVKGAAPGTYKLFAWEDIENGGWLDPDVLRDFEGKGEPVIVKAGDPDIAKQTVDLHVIQ